MNVKRQVEVPLATRYCVRRQLRCGPNLPSPRRNRHLRLASRRPIATDIERTRRLAAAPLKPHTRSVATPCMASCLRVARTRPTTCDTGGVLSVQPVVPLPLLPAPGLDDAPPVLKGAACDPPGSERGDAHSVSPSVCVVTYVARLSLSTAVGHVAITRHCASRA